MKDDKREPITHKIKYFGFRANTSIFKISISNINSVKRDNCKVMSAYTYTLNEGRSIVWVDLINSNPTCIHVKGLVFCA